MVKFTQADYKNFSLIAAKTTNVKPFINDTPAKKSRRIKKATGDNWQAFSYFCKSYFPHIFKLPFADDHKEMFDTTENYNGITSITGYRGLGKTVVMGVVYPIWKIIKGERYVIHAAADADLAEERTAFTYSLMWSLIIQESNLNVAVKDTVLKEMLSNEAKLKSYLLGEDKPEEVVDFAIDAGLFITIHVPTKLTSWKSFLRDRSDKIEFRVYRYLNHSVDEAELVYEELDITTSEPEIHHKCEIYLLPGRYYFRLSGCESAICESSEFCPEHEFIAFNASEHYEDKLPKWTETPSSPLWFAIYDLEFNICLDSMYLGFQKKMFEDRNLLEHAFYHCPDGEGILRTFIYDGVYQIFEGIRY